MNIKQVFSLSVLALALGACGVNGDKIFSANANDDFYADVNVGTSFTADVLGNDGGSGGFVEDCTNGFYGSCTIGTGALDIDYQPFPVNDGEYFADWFEYRVRSNNNAYSVGRVSVRFTEIAADRYEPDDFEQFARPISLDFGIPVVEDHTSDYTNVIPLVGTYAQGQTVGGDEDWFQVDLQAAPTGGLVTWFRIETILPNVAAAADHNSLLVTVMDQYGFLVGSAGSGSGPGGNDAYSGSDATTFDQTMAAGRYLIRISPDNGHRGEYTVRFTMYEAAPLMAPPAPIGVGHVQK